MHRFGLLLLMMILVIAGCNTTTETPAPTLAPTALLAQATANAQAAKTLRVAIDRTGADYLFTADMGTVVFNSLGGQYVAPDIIQATARVLLGRLPVDLEVYARGEDQWIRGVFTNMEWQNTIFAPGFNPQTLLSQPGTGLQTALTALKDVQLAGEEALEDGTAAYHLTSTAQGPDVSALVVNIVQMTGEVTVDVYVDKARLLPVKFVIVQPDTVTAEQPEPTQWTIELYDFDAEAELTPPEGQ